MDPYHTKLACLYNPSDHQYIFSKLDYQSKKKKKKKDYSKLKFLWKFPGLFSIFCA